MTPRPAEPQPDPSPRRLVLTNRELRSNTLPARLSQFVDDIWDLTPGILEDHYPATALNFAGFPPDWKNAAKDYLWMLLNDDTGMPRRRVISGSRLSVRTVLNTKLPLERFLTWLSAHQITAPDFGPDIQEDFLQELNKSPYPNSAKTAIIMEIRRLWSYRERVEYDLQLPGARPWAGDNARDLIGTAKAPVENRTPRIADTTMAPLLTWAIRFVDDFSADIIAAYAYAEAHRPRRGSRPRAAPLEGTRKDRLRAALAELRASGRGIPSREIKGGARVINYSALGVLAQCSGQAIKIYDQHILAESALNLDSNFYVETPITGLIDGRPWRSTPLPFFEAQRYFEALATACFVVIGYLSGMRPSEALSLRRGCCTFDEATGLWLLTGTYFKGATDDTGAKAAYGAIREHPWVVAAVVGRAIDVLEAMHGEPLLFTRTMRSDNYAMRLDQTIARQSSRMGLARTTSQVTAGIETLRRLVNDLCSTENRTDRIPSDPEGNIAPSRFRRTLAWHIVRRPGGLVAAALQYGHIDVQVTQGYAGKYDTGFIDDLALETWLKTLDDLDALSEYLDSGGRVSGPATHEFTKRTHEASAKFAGRVVSTGRQARTLLADSTLQVFPGRGMHCVFNRTTALCLRDDDNTPNIANCRSTCTNIARTSSDIVQVAEDLQTIEDIAARDTLAPTPRHTRLIARQSQLRKVINEHEAGLNG